LRLMLDAHPSIAVPPESHFVVSLPRVFGAAPTPQAIEALLAHQRFREWGLDEGRFSQALDAREPATWADLYDTVFSLYATEHGKQRWGDKTPGYGRFLDELRQIFPSARFVHLIRDGRDVACSLARVPWYEGSIVRMASDWKKSVRRARRSGLGRDDYLEVRYEDLVTDTVPTLHRVCSHLDVIWADSMLAYPRRLDDKLPSHRKAWHQRTREGVSSDRIGIWRREMTAVDLWNFERVAGDLLEELGYGREARFSLRGAAAAATGRARRYVRRAARLCSRP